MAVFKNKGKSFDTLISKAKEDLPTRELHDWVNLQTTKDQFTALHYASYRGNIHFCEKLMENGADKEKQNAYGLNVLHIAAQGDQPISLFFFKIQKMDLTAKDNRGSTPLHWACFQNSEIALIYLLGWLKQKNLNI
jgi:palmitoyltransferase ZDHHC13/17